MTKKLVVIVPDRISDLLNKGEVTARYYNPGDLFDEVHLVLTNNDQPDIEKLSPMVGRATAFVHNIDVGPRFFHKTLGWQFPLIKDYLGGAMRLIEEINPMMIRTHNNFLEGYIAVTAKEKLGIPFVTSLHGVWDRDPADVRWLHDRIIRCFRRKLEKATLQKADGIIAVYQPICDYAKRLKGNNIRLIYNAVSSNIALKQNYNLNTPPRLITINRQVEQKNPENIIRAVAQLNCHYTIVGQGPLNGKLKALAAELGCADRVEFIDSIDNQTLMAELGTYDILVAHCDYLGISKSTIEAALAGIPVVVNRQKKGNAPDIEGGWVKLVDNSMQSYKEALSELLQSKSERIAQAAKGKEHALKSFDPHAMEQKIVELYEEVLGKVSC